MRRALAALAALVLTAGCGSEDDEPDTLGTTGATGAQGGGEPYDITVAEFIAELQPEKQEILKAYVAQSDACAGTRVAPSFVLLVTAAALEVPKGEPLGAIVEEQCSDG